MENRSPLNYPWVRVGPFLTTSKGPYLNSSSLAFKRLSELNRLLILDGHLAQALMLAGAHVALNKWQASDKLKAAGARGP